MMKIAFNMPLQGSYARNLLAGVLDAVRAFPEASLWLPYAQIEQVRPGVVDGVIGIRHPEGLEGLKPGIPAINVHSMPQPDTWQVSTDNDAIGRLAFDHLRANGVCSFAVLRNPSRSHHWQRLHAFIQCARDAGFPARIIESRADEFPEQAKKLPVPTGMLFISDALARRFVRGCKKRAISVPESICIVSVNNSVRLCTSGTPHLTSIDVASDRIGYEALRLLVRIVQGEVIPQTPVMVPPQELVARRSSARTVLSDENIERALAYMARNFGSPLVYDDILAEQDLGARALEMRFKQRFGVPPMRYLRDLRLDRVKDLLETTKLSVAEIGRRCGFPSSNHLCALFRRTFESTPLAYRRQSQSR